MERIHNPPNWEQMFNASVRIVTTNIDKNNGQQMVVQMLEFGKRLYVEASKKDNERKKKWNM